MLKFKSFDAEIIRLNLIRIFWDVEESNEPIGNFRFVVMRSNSPGGPFISISNPLVNVFQFFDPTKQMKSKYRKFYYKLRITDNTTGEILDSDVAGLDSKPDLFLLEIRRRHDLYLRRFVGVPAAILVSRSRGERCGDCWDRTTMRQTKSSCSTCFNTGFAKGYFDQIDTFINFSPNAELVAILALGETQPVLTPMWMSSFPLLSPRDMIVEFPVNSEQIRWRVEKVGKTERLRATSRQICGLIEINRSDIEYNFAVNKVLPPPDEFLGFRPPNGSGLL